MSSGVPKPRFIASYVDRITLLWINSFRVWHLVADCAADFKTLLAAVGIFSFQFTWNDFLSPLIYLGGNLKLWTMALGLNMFHGIEGEENTLNFIMVMPVLMIIPMLLIFSMGQSYMIEGVISSGLKG